jgi:cytochrome c peroxidase
VRGTATLGAVALVGALLQPSRPELPLGLDRYRPVPEDNPLTKERVDLGRRLFGERRFSRDGATSCATCHDPRRAFADGRPVAVGAAGGVGRRNVPALLNRAWGTSFFWDGRAVTLEQQTLQPILNPIEIGATPDRVMRVIRTPDYTRAFRRAFDAVPTFASVPRALAAYVRTIVAGDSPFDRHVAGDSKALGPSAARGRRVFEGPAACNRCHVGVLFTDEDFHNTGIAWRERPGASGLSAREPSDIGRAAVTGRTEDRGAFKTPSLRQVSRTAPYMHDGSLPTLQAVVEYYDSGGQPNARLDHRLRPLYLSAQQRADLVAFLFALTGSVREGW